MIIVRKGECISQIVGQFAQCIILPYGPSASPLETQNTGVDVWTGIGKMMAMKGSGSQRAFQIGQGVAVRLKGAEQEGQGEPSGAKASSAA